LGVCEKLDRAFANREGITLDEHEVFIVWMKLARGKVLELTLREVADHPVEARAAHVKDGESAQDLARRLFPPND